MPSWIVRWLAVVGLVVVGWVLLTAGSAVVHGHPAYPTLLGLTVLGALGALWLHRRRRDPVRGWGRVGAVALVVGAVGWLVAVAWLRPFQAQEPALTAMRSDGLVRVTESPTRIVLEPFGAASPTALFFQPGARVDARAYAAVLRPVAEAGQRVVIVKQALGIAFLALRAFDGVRADYPDVDSWVVGGHSLGGTVAAIQADDADEDAEGPVRGLLLHASYPASDMSGSLTAQVLSVWGTADGLATPADIEASKADLPPDALFVPVPGAVHAFFGDYGAQPGDGFPTTSRDHARTVISNASVQFVAQTAGATTD